MAVGWERNNSITRSVNQSVGQSISGSVSQSVSLSVSHFTTIRCEPYTAHKVLRKPYFAMIFAPMLKTDVVCVFRSDFKALLR